MSVENKFDQAKGSIKESFGKLTGDSKTQTQGIYSLLFGL